MRILCALALALPLSLAAASSASADFIPGRVRPEFQAEMMAVNATGAFANVGAALVTLNFEDGKAQPVSVSVTLAGEGVTKTFLINQIHASGCGDHLEANAIQNGTVHFGLELIDYSHATCEKVIASKWAIMIKQSAPGRAPSELDLEGNPEPLIVTL